jgi:hypothetical protein
LASDVFRQRGTGELALDRDRLPNAHQLRRPVRRGRSLLGLGAHGLLFAVVVGVVISLLVAFL